MGEPVIIVVGAGPGLGAAIARRFGRAGYAVALISRGEQQLEQLGAELQADGITAGWSAADITDGPALRAAVDRFAGFSGTVDQVHFNPSLFRETGPLELTADELLDDVRLGAASLLDVVQAARPHMTSGGRITATGSMAADQPWHRAASLGVQKAALRNLVQSIDAAVRDDGIRAASLTVNGMLGEGTPFDAGLVADALHAASVRTDADWTTEVAFDGG